MRSDHRLLVVHAHPDDESEFGAGTVARYHAEGVRTVLVCCTDGGQGKVRNPDVGAVGVRAADVVEVRRRELEAGAAIIGFDRVVRLDFPDSGSVGLTDRPASCFARLPLDEVVRPVIEAIRLERPQVVMAYADDQRSYPHPDHLRAHEVALRAFEDAGNPEAHPELGPAWPPERLYYTVTSRERRKAINASYVKMGLAAPFSQQVGFQGRGDPDLAPGRERVTAVVDVKGYVGVWIAGLRAHACQMNPALDEVLGIPPSRAAELFAEEEFVLAPGGSGHEDPDSPASDLFAGI
jgi:mycothiol S-conjugate amidase